MKRANALFKEGNQSKAKDIYVAIGEILMELIKETDDDKHF